MWLREEEAWELARGKYVDGHFLQITGEEALLLVIAPSAEVLETSIEKAGMRPFAPRDFPHGASCKHGHERTSKNTVWDKEKYLICLTCRREQQEIYAAKDPEQTRARKRANYYRMAQNPEWRKKRNAQKRRWQATPRGQETTRRAWKRRVAAAGTSKPKKASLKSRDDGKSQTEDTGNG